MYRHRKYIVEPSLLGACLVGDRWEPVNADAETPLVILLGDTVEQGEYRVEHAAGLVEKVFGEFKLAAREAPGEAGLLVLPFPPGVSARGSAFRQHIAGAQGVGHLKRVGQAIRDEADVDLDAAPASLIGHGAGAFLATGLALTQPNIQALSCLGGEAMDVAVASYDEAAWERLSHVPMLIISNEGDTLQSECREFAGQIRAHGLHVMEEHPAGGHDLEDYLANGSLRDAFTFALTYLPD